jgi:hypothetical protein
LVVYPCRGRLSQPWSLIPALVVYPSRGRLSRAWSLIPRTAVWVQDCGHRPEVRPRCSFASLLMGSVLSRSTVCTTTSCFRQSWNGESGETCCRTCFYSDGNDHGWACHLNNCTTCYKCKDHALNDELLVTRNVCPFVNVGVCKSPEGNPSMLIWSTFPFVRSYEFIAIYIYIMYFYMFIYTDFFVRSIMSGHTHIFLVFWHKFTRCDIRFLRV